MADAPDTLPKITGLNPGEAYTSLMILAAAAAAAVAAPDMVQSQDPGSLITALQAAGYKAKLGTDKVGDPLIESAVSGSDFAILFYNCVEHRNCKTIQFFAGYNMDKAPSLGSLNEWNRTNRFGRAFLDKENDPILQMDLDLDDGGMSPALFIDNLEYWALIIDDFEKSIGW